MTRTGWMSLAFAGLLIAGGQAWCAAQEASKSDRPSQSDDPKAKADQPADGKLKPSESQPKKKLRRADDDDDSDDGNAPSTQGRRFTNPQDLFSEMERMMQQLDQGWPQLNGVFRGRPFDFRFLDNDAFGQVGSSYGPGSHVSVQRTDDQGSRKLEFDVKQDGSVEAEVTTDGKTEKIEAKTFDDFRNMHGDVLKEFGIGGAPRSMIQQEPDRGMGRGRALQPVPNVEPRGKKLGVKVTPVSEDLAAYLDLDEGVGLLVREVVDGTLAARMGVKRGDVVVEVDGEPATGTEVIAKALARQDGSPIDLVVIRKGNRVTLHGAS